MIYMGPFQNLNFGAPFLSGNRKKGMYKIKKCACMALGHLVCGNLISVLCRHTAKIHND